MLDPSFREVSFGMLSCASSSSRRLGRGNLLWRVLLLILFLLLLIRRFGHLFTLANILLKDRGLGDLRASQQISQFECLDQIGIPDHASVLDTNILESLINLVDLLDTLIQ